MQGAPPLASPRLNPGGTGAGGESRALRGGAPPAPLRLNPGGTGFSFGKRLESGAQRGACPVGRLPTLPPLSPEGGGGGVVAG